MLYISFFVLLVSFFFFFNDTATTEIYTVSDTLSLHDALPISCSSTACTCCATSRSCCRRSEEHTSELQSPDTISYAVFCLKKKNKNTSNNAHNTQPKKKAQHPYKKRK